MADMIPCKHGVYTSYDRCRDCEDEKFLAGLERITKMVAWRKRFKLFSRLPYSWQVWLVCHL